MSTKRKVRARKAFGAYGNQLYTSIHFKTGCGSYWLLPADAESYDAIRRNLANFFYAEFRPSPLSWKKNPRLTQFARKMANELACGSLAAIGLHRPTTKEKK